MKRIFLSLFVVVAMAACNNEQKASDAVTDNSANVSAGAAVEASEGAAFEFEKETYDFGQITEGELVSYEFNFTNVGKEPLIITSAAASCGCTVPDYSREPIAPNEKGKIHVKFDSKNTGGMQNKVVTITANTSPATTELHLIGDVKPKKN